MKKFFIYASIILIAVACAPEKREKAEETVDVSKKVADISAPIVKMLKDSLLAELNAAIKSGGPVQAIDVCNIKALPITDAVAKNSNLNIELKRVSNKFRNPMNAPDDDDKNVLAQYESDFAKGVKPPDYIVITSGAKGNEYHCYYTPLKIMPLCLNCHGDVAAMNPALVKKLNELYPQDKATGYREGEFRGLVKVKITGKI